MALVYDRRLATVKDEPQFGGAALYFFYHTMFGRTLLKWLVRPSVSKIVAWYSTLPCTKHRADQYVRRYQIDRNSYSESNWRTFAAFFNRKLSSLQVETDEYALVACAESALMTYPISKDAMLNVKHRSYRLTDIIGDELLAAKFEGGTAFVYRLAMHNYHRYIYPNSGKIIAKRALPGVLHTISSVSQEFPVYSINQRHVSILEVHGIGIIAMIEVGAMIAGKIVNDGPETFVKGCEKGHFEIGGSTIIVLYTKDRVQVDEDIQKNNSSGVEVSVNIGETIGRLCLND